MPLTGKSNEEKIWNYLKGKGLNDYGVAGLMGNLYAESALNPQNLQNTSERKLGLTDTEYTAAVDSGAYTGFVRDSAGYGLAQWTYWSRKEALLKYVQAAGASIGDLETQLGFLYKELSEGYANTVLKKLETATSVKEASDVVLTKYERPADQSAAVKTKRAEYGQTYYDKYACPEVSERQQIVAMAASFSGCKESDGSHKQIIDIYNRHKPLARGYKVKYTDAWCATFVSAVAIKCGLTSLIPTECGCEKMIALFQKLGTWQENDAHTPQPGDIIFYDWDDAGTGDNTGYSDHVGIVEKVSGTTVTIIEGNLGNAVGRRTMKVNSRYVRGYGVPKYKGKASSTASSTGAGNTGKKLAFKVGDVVKFTGSRHYSSANAASGPACKAGNAKVTAVYPTGKHPYHVVKVSGSGSTVHGWVDAKDLKKIGAIAIGDVVNFAGGYHYKSSNDSSKANAATAGPAKVTAISKGAKHPYHVIHTNKKSNVYGWVDADKLSK